VRAGEIPEAVTDRSKGARVCPWGRPPRIVLLSITLDTYSHVMPGMQEEAAEKIDAGLRAALAG
jgi:hypothetical protein